MNWDKVWIKVRYKGREMEVQFNSLVGEIDVCVCEREGIFFVLCRHYGLPINHISYGGRFMYTGKIRSGLGSGFKTNKKNSWTMLLSP